MTPGKRRYDLIPPAALRLVADCFTNGTKHDPPGGPPGWTTAPNGRTEYTAAAMRHFEEYREGTWIDPSSGLPHLAHAATNLIILLALEIQVRLGKV